MFRERQPGDGYSATYDEAGNLVSETITHGGFIQPVRPFGTGAWGLFLMLIIWLALAGFSCLAADLSQSISRTAPVSVVFLCPDTGTPNFGVAGGYTKPAQAGKTVAGLIARENPDSREGNQTLKPRLDMIAPNSSESASVRKRSVAAKLAAFQSAVILASHEQGQRIGEVHTLVKLWAVELKLSTAAGTVASLEAERAQLLKKGGAL